MEFSGIRTSYASSVGQVPFDGGIIARYESSDRLRYLKVDVDRRHDLDPPDRPHHGSVDFVRFLEGHARTKHGIERDSQRKRLYRAQRAAGVKDQAQEFESLFRCAQSVASILRGKAWQQRYEVLTVHLKPGYGARRPKAISEDRRGPLPDESIIILPTRGRNKSTIVHELIHLTVPEPHPGHGRLYCARFLEVVQGFGEDIRDRLEAAYKRHGVKYTPREIRASA